MRIIAACDWFSPMGICIFDGEHVRTIWDLV